MLCVTVLQGHYFTYTGNRNMAEIVSPASKWTFAGQYNLAVIIIKGVIFGSYIALLSCVRMLSTAVGIYF